MSRYQKGKTNLDFTEARDSEWQWHQLGHMQICTSLQTDNHANTSSLSFLQAGCPSLPATQPTASKHWRHDLCVGGKFYPLIWNPQPRFVYSLGNFGGSTHTHTRLMALCPGLPRWAGTRKVKPIWILLEQETVSGSGISWAICKSAPCTSLLSFYRPDALPAAQPTVSKHWRQ